MCLWFRFAFWRGRLSVCKVLQACNFTLIFMHMSNVFTGACAGVSVHFQSSGENRKRKGSDPSRRHVVLLLCILYSGVKALSDHHFCGVACALLWKCLDVAPCLRGISRWVVVFMRTVRLHVIILSCNSHLLVSVGRVCLGKVQVPFHFSKRLPDYPWSCPSRTDKTPQNHF